MGKSIEATVSGIAGRSRKCQSEVCGMTGFAISLLERDQKLVAALQQVSQGAWDR